MLRLSRPRSIAGLKRCAWYFRSKELTSTIVTTETRSSDKVPLAIASGYDLSAEVKQAGFESLAEVAGSEKGPACYGKRFCTALRARSRTEGANRSSITPPRLRPSCALSAG